MVPYTFNPSTQQAEDGGFLCVLGHSSQHRGFPVSQSYTVRCCLKTQNKQNQFSLTIPTTLNVIMLMKIYLKFVCMCMCLHKRVYHIYMRESMQVRRGYPVPWSGGYEAPCDAGNQTWVLCQRNNLHT